MTKFEDNISPYLSFVEGSAPSSPAATNFRLYYDSSDHLLKWKNSAGTVTTIATGTAAAGALVLLEQHTASASATLDFTAFISSTYDDYVIRLIKIVPATNNVSLLMRMGTGGGPTFDSGANYGHGQWIWIPGATTIQGASSGATSIFLTQSNTGTLSNTSTKGWSGQLQLTDPQGSGHKQVVGQGVYDDAGGLKGVSNTGIYLSTTAVTGLQFLMSSGNIASGTIRVYGVAK